MLNYVKININKTQVAILNSAPTSLLIPSIAGNTLDARQQENFSLQKGFMAGMKGAETVPRRTKKKEMSTRQIAGAAGNQHQGKP
jgi:hypothetical protein